MRNYFQYEMLIYTIKFDVKQFNVLILDFKK